MLIDWFTVIAQALNFLILVWLMKRFLYQPILHAIDEREKRVAAQLADADRKKDEARKERDEFKNKTDELDRQRAALMSAAEEEARARRQALLDEAHAAAETVRVQWQQTLQNEKNTLYRELSRRTQQEVFAIARKTLGDLAGTGVEEGLITVFIGRLKDMDAPAKAVLADSVKRSSGDALVRSSFDMPAPQRDLLQTALNETFPPGIPLRFETAPDLIGGIELTINGQKVAWSIADYIASMEQNVDELLAKNNKPVPAPEGASAPGTGRP